MLKAHTRDWLQDSSPHAGGPSTNRGERRGRERGGGGSGVGEEGKGRRRRGGEGRKEEGEKEEVWRASRRGREERRRATTCSSPLKGPVDQSAPASRRRGGVHVTRGRDYHTSDKLEHC